MTVRFKVNIASAVVTLGLGVGVAVAQSQVPSIAGSGNTLQGVWFENDVRTGGEVSGVDISSAGGNLRSAPPLLYAALRLTMDAANAAKTQAGVLQSYGSAGFP